MAKLYFRYSAMGAGKSIDLLKVAYNYEERGQRVILFTSQIDDRYGEGKIATRVGMQKDANLYSKETNIYECVSKLNEAKDISCVLLDEAQFLTKKQVYELTDIVDFLDIPVICYGLRTDYNQDLFEGSKYLLALSDKVEELKTICKCGRKATSNMRIIDGKATLSGGQLQIGGNESYISVCRKCYKEAISNIK